MLYIFYEGKISMKGICDRCKHYSVNLTDDEVFGGFMCQTCVQKAKEDYKKQTKDFYKIHKPRKEVTIEMS